jgi:RNA polymerase sigma-70 factor (ECF subfamily)
MAAGAYDIDASGQFTSGSTASDLLAAAKQSDPQAWRDLVDRYTWLIVRWCRDEGLSNNDVPDVLQAVLLRVFQKLGEFQKDGRTAAFRRWLRTVTRNQVAGFRRQALKEPRGDGGSSAQRRFLAVAQAGLTDEKSPLLDSLLDRFWTLVDRLEETVEASTWQAFWLTTFENLNSAEAGQLLEMTPASVRLAKARVLRRIRAEDAQLADELNRVKSDGHR